MDEYEPKRPKPKLFEQEHNNKKSKKQEKRIANKLNGKRQKGSGAIRHHKGDVKTPDLLLEAKRSDKDSISLKKEWLEKISKEALVSGRVPALAIEFGTADILTAARWIAVPENFFQELMEAYTDENDDTEGSGSI